MSRASRSDASENESVCPGTQSRELETGQRRGLSLAARALLGAIKKGFTCLSITWRHKHLYSSFTTPARWSRAHQIFSASMFREQL